MKRPFLALFVIITALLAFDTFVLAGATLDYGRLTNTPASDTVTYVTYLTETAGEEILTEDSYNAEIGTDQGYQSGYWWLSVAALDTEDHGDEVQIYFAGSGSESDKRGSLTFNWIGDEGFADHGTVTFETNAGPAAPTDLNAQANTTASTIHLTWTDGNGGTEPYQLYRSTQASGASNDASNGHYFRVDSFTYTCGGGTCSGGDSNPAEGTNWYIILPEGAPGAHSNESHADGPTAATLASFSARMEEDGVLLQWETITEVDTQGFHLYRAAAHHGERLRLNEALIPGVNLGGVRGGAYEFKDESAPRDSTLYYWLEHVDVYGGIQEHGPVSAALPAGNFPIHLPLILRK
jgi:hypothetical protein